jgi:hypothetical protein
MSQDALLLLLVKITLIADIVSIAAFVGDYSRLARWWKNPVGRTIVIKDLFLLALIALTTLSVFFQFSRLTSRVAAWAQIGLLAAMAVTMAMRIVVFEKIHRRKGGDEHGNGGG